jgi:hypothetical protein
VLKKLKPEINEGEKLSKKCLKVQPLNFYGDSIRKSLSTMDLFDVPPCS